MSRRKIVGVRAVAPGTEPPKEEKKEEKKEEIKINQKVKDDFLEVLYYQAKQRDGLLGDFDAKGNYSITNEKILEDLVTLPKVLQEKSDEIVYASTKLGKYVINFKVELDISESYCTAKLYIIEMEHKFDESIKHVQLLAEEVEIYSPLFVENVFKLWNIVRTPVELDKRNIVVTYLELQERNELFMKELSDVLAQLYVMRMLEVLNNCGEIGDKIFYEYKKMLDKLSKENPDFLLSNINLKNLLDGIILKNNAFDLVMSKGGEELMKAYADPINKLRGKEPEAKVENIELAGKKPEKKASASKSAGKSASKDSGSKSKSGGGKKKDKPKDKPKDKSKDKPKNSKPLPTSFTEPKVEENKKERSKELSEEEKARIKEEAKKDKPIDLNDMDLSGEGKQNENKGDYQITGSFILDQNSMAGEFGGKSDSKENDLRKEVKQDEAKLNKEDMQSKSSGIKGNELYIGKEY